VASAEAAVPASPERAAADPMAPLPRPPRGPTRGGSPSGRPGGAAVEAGELQVIADEATNSLIAVGPPRLLERLGAMIETLDVRQPQVMVEVLLVTLNESETLDLGVELQALLDAGGTLYRLSSLFGLGNVGPGGGLPEIEAPG